MKPIYFKYSVISLLSLLLFVISKNGLKNNTKSDPQLTLLTSQSILENGTTNLYNYYSQVKPEEFADGTWKYMLRNEQKKVFYFYPIGTSLLSIPVVAVAKLAGYDFTKKEDDTLWQSLISSVCVCVIFILLMLLAQHYVSFKVAIVFSFLTCLGSSIISSVGLALWSFNYELILLLISFIHISKTYSQPQTIKGYKLGVLLFFSWLCRPSALVIIGIIALWLFLVNKKELLKYIAVVIILFIPFAIYSKINYHIIVPPYYHPLFWAYMISNETFLSKLAAVLVSPARGFFIFTPVFILPFLGLFIKEARKNTLFVMALFWFILHCVMLARQANWWGGWSFGPRLFTDALIPVFIMLVITYTKIKENKSPIYFALFVILSVPGVAIHAIKGAYNNNTHTWNDCPAIDENISYYKWNTDYLQFFATPQSNAKKKEEYEIIKQLKKGVFKLKNGSHVLIDGNTDNTGELSEKLNKTEPYAHLVLHHTLQSILDNKVDTFFITKNLLEKFSNDTNYVVIKKQRKGISTYMKEHAARHIFIAIKHSVFNNLLDDSKAYFKSMHSKAIDITEKQGCVIHVFNGKIVNEFMTPKVAALINYTINTTNIKVSVDGNALASAIVDDNEYSINDDGFNILCISSEGELVDITCFNANDEENEYHYKVYKK
jgi:hypothetical protein